MPVSLYCLASFNPHLFWTQVCEPFMKLSASFSITWVQSLLWAPPIRNEVSQKKLNMCFLCLRSFSSTSESDLFSWWFIDPCQSSPSRRTKSRISYREHTELVDESILPEGISTKTIPAVGEVLKLDLLLTVSCRCLNKNRYDTLLGCLEKIPGYMLT